jgi:alpha-acetolactate decarboxylase
MLTAGGKTLVTSLSGVKLVNAVKAITPDGSQQQTIFIKQQQQQQQPEQQQQQQPTIIGTIQPQPTNKVSYTGYHYNT